MTNILTTPKNTSSKPHIYKVTNFETGQYYIGSQCSGKVVGVNYFTSSTNKAFKEDFKNCGEKYEITIVKSFIDPDECVRVENYMIRDHMLLKDGLCLNRFYCCNGEKIFSRVGTHHSEDTKQKMSTSHKGHTTWNKGIPQSEATKKKMSTSHKGHTTWNKGIPAWNRIKISIEDVTFDSITEASKYYNVSITAIRKWAKNKKHNAIYIEK